MRPHLYTFTAYFVNFNASFWLNRLKAQKFKEQTGDGENSFTVSSKTSDSLKNPKWQQSVPCGLLGRDSKWAKTQVNV